MDNSQRIQYTIDRFAAAKISITAEMADKLVRLCDFMVEYNENVNLTSITEFEEVVDKHFVDSVLPFSWWRSRREAHLLTLVPVPDSRRCRF